MDLFAHGLLGFVLGQALQLDTNAQIILIISSVILDIDALLAIGGWKASFRFHRGRLHSFLGATLISLPIATAGAVLMRLPTESFIWIVLICLVGSFSHVSLDLLTPRSMAVLWPFSKEKISFDLTHFVDPIFLGVLLLASIFVIYAKIDVKMIQIVTIVAMVLLTVNFGVRYYEKNVAIENVRKLDANAHSKVMALPTLRPDRWWVAIMTPFESGHCYEIYSVDSIDNRILSHSTVKSPFIDYRGPAKPSVEFLQAVANSKRDKRISAFIEQSRLPAVNVTLSDDGSTWQVFWYDVFTQLSEGVNRGITVKVESD